MSATATVAGVRRTAAKITQPRLARPFARQRLHTLLDGMLAEHAVVWVAAPAGFGKTSLVSSYLQGAGRQVVWYRIDERDEDIATCFHYLSLLAAQLDSAEPADLPRYNPEYARGLTAFARGFFGGFFAAVPERAVLVFDNYHELPDEAALHQVMQVAMEELPADCQVIIISRHLPPPAYMRLQANQRLAILEQAELGFNEDEALALLVKRGHDVSDGAEFRRWLATNRGWAAGLVLYAEWARLGHGNIGRLESLGTEAVFDYFAGEIHSRIAEQDARVLAENALLPVMKPALAAELTGFAAAGELLNRLHRRNTFTIRFDGAVVAYEFHPLFREYLLKELTRTHGPEALAELQVRAADLLARDGQIESALDLLATARRWPRLGELLCQHATELINHGRHRLVGQWLAQFPDDAFDAKPWLAYWQGACRIFESATESQAWMERAYQRFKEIGQVEGIYRAWCGVCRAIRFTWDDYRRYDPWIDELEALLNAEAPTPALECEALLNAVGALHWRNPAHPRMREWIARALTLADASNDLRLKVDAHARVAFLELTHDEVPKAARRIRHLERLLASPVDDPFVMILTDFVRGLYAYATGDSARAAAIFQASIDQAHALGLLTWDVILFAWWGLAQLAHGDLQGALRARDRLEHDPAIQGPYGAHYYHRLCADIALEQSDSEQAMLYAREALAAAERAGSPFMQAWALTTVALLEVLKGSAHAAEDLDATACCVSRLGSRWLETSRLMGQALHACQHGSAEAARQALQEAMNLMRAQTLLHMGHAPEPLRLFAARALEYGVESDYARKILAANPGVAGSAPPAHLEAWPWALKVYTLGSFRLVKNGMPVTFGRKPPRRPLQILQALIAMGGREVPEARILDALWPDDEADAARNAFSTALNRLRHIVGREHVRLEGGKLSLDATRCWVDAWAFEALLKRAGHGAEPVTDLDSLRQALALYNDNFLSNETEASWAASLRDRLQDRYASALTRVALACQEAGDHEGAVSLFKRGLTMDALREEYYQGLMRSFLALDAPEEARQAFEICKRRLAMSLNRKPSAATLALYQAIGERIKVSENR